MKKLMKHVVMAIFAILFLSGITRAESVMADTVNVTESDVNLSKTTYEYDMTKHEPNINVTVNGTPLIENKDYTINYDGNLISAGEHKVILTFNEPYQGTITKTFTINPCPIDKVDILSIGDKEYTGSAIETGVMLQLNGKFLETKDYTTTYENNINAGTATITITGKENYVGSTTTTFKITPKSLNNVIAPKIPDQEYTGSPIIPTFTYMDGDIELKKDVDYKVLDVWENTEIGYAYIEIEGIRNYKDINIFGFNIVAAKQDEPVQNNQNTNQNTGGTGNDNLGSKNQNSGSGKSINSINLSALSGQIAAGKSIQLNVSIVPETSQGASLTWSSSNPSVAIVDQNGRVTVKKNTGGKTVAITATAANGRKATFTIKAMKGIVKKVSITGKKVVKAGKKIKLKAKVKATKGANKKLIWTSSNTKYATVTRSGKVKTKKAGKGKKVRIIAMATDGSNKKASVVIRIK